MIYILWKGKCIHLKNEIGVFSYYHSHIYIQIKELIDPNSLEDVLVDVINNENDDKFKITIDEENYSDHISSLYYNIFLIKLSSNKFSIAYYSDYESCIIIIVIFDLYGDNEDNLFIRYYKINLDLYNLRLQDYLYLQLFKFNSFLGMAFIGFNANDVNPDEDIEDYEDYKGIFAIFGYSSKIY